MVIVDRYKDNPILKPYEIHPWEATAAFNGCVIKDKRKFNKDKFHIVYRAMSYNKIHRKVKMNVSSIGHATSKDGINFGERHTLIRPELDWEIFGCEDPRITKLNRKYFIFYTSLSNYPPTPDDIKIGVGITKNFVNVEKHDVTFFNSKAMTLFPKKINGGLAGILTVNTDLPPAKICVAFFDKEEEIWSKAYWKDWFYTLDDHIIPLARSEKDQTEIGAPPIKTNHGWLLIYSYIKNYLSPPPTFGIEAALLDLKNPSKIIGRTTDPLLVPKTEYELHGNVPNVVFPSGAIIQNKKLFIYYGAADTTCCVAMCDLQELVQEMLKSS